MNYFCTTLLFFTLVIYHSASAQINQPKVISKIAFGSCNHQDNPQLIWDSVLQDKPELFIFLGDNIYGDTKNMTVLQEKYNKLGSKAGYQKLQQNCEVIATWDDHDYGVNDGGKEYPKKEESKKIFLDFFKEPDTSSRWKHKGIYTSYYYGVEGKKLQVIVLDCRTFRDKLVAVRADLSCKGPFKKALNKNKTFLGEEQWKWLEEELKQPADLRIIATSTQFLVDFNGWEAWVNMPHERERFLKLIEKTKAEGVYFISGDLHYAELSGLKRDNMYTIYDLTSSGLTHGHSCEGGNELRVGKPFMEANYGVISIDWNATSSPKLRFEIKDEKRTTHIFHELNLNQLKF